MQELLGERFRRRRRLTAQGHLDEGEHAAIAAIVAGNDRLSPLQQAEIYREQFWLRHVEALEEDFPGLAYLLGDAAFDELLRAYLEAVPPRSWTLRDLGAELPAFCARYGGFDPAIAGPASAMARFDWAFVDVFDGAPEERPPITLDDVRGIAPAHWPTVRFAFDGTLVLMTLDHAVVDLRIAVRKGEAPPREVDAVETHVALWRKASDLKVHYRAIGVGEKRTLEALRAGAPLGEALDAVVSGLPPEEVASLGDDLRAWFEGWAKRGWVVGLGESPEAPTT